MQTGENEDKGENQENGVREEEADDHEWPDTRLFVTEKNDGRLTEWFGL